MSMQSHSLTGVNGGYASLYVAPFHDLYEKFQENLKLDKMLFAGRGDMNGTVRIKWTQNNFELR
jgi:hypothetical protein